MNKKTLLIVLAMMFSITASAYDALVNGIYYYFSGTEASVTNDGNSFSLGSYSGNITIPKTVSYNNVTYNVSSIGNNAFNNCSALTSVTIPNSVTSIGHDAFYNCSSLTTINIPNGLTSIGRNVFSSCSSLTAIDIPNSVTSIEGGAFYNCSSLTSITIPNSVTSIGDYAFYGTPWYDNQPDGVVYVGKVLYRYKRTGTMPEETQINIKDGTVSIADGAFYFCKNLVSVTIPNSVTFIGSYAFRDCSSLTAITIPNSITSIGFYAFDSCSSLTSITIPNSVITIGSGAFYDCNNLTSITIPNSVTSIGDNAFSGTPWYDNQPDGLVYVGKVLYRYKGTMSEEAKISIKDGTVGIGDNAFNNCKKLISVTIPNSVTSIGNSAFNNCSSLNAITIPSSITSIGISAFEGCSSLNAINIPNSVTYIGDYAFRGCSGLTSITIPNNVTYINVGVFSSCIGLTSVTIPNSVTTIGSGVFEFCSSLTAITIPNSVNTIGIDVFHDCSCLTSVTVEAKTPTKISGDVFTNRANATLYVPSGCKAAYETADYWKEFKEIFEIENSPVAEYTDEQGVKYSLDDDENTYSVSGYTDACSREVTILSSVNGCSVTSIGDNAFYSFSELTSVNIPNSVTSIGDWAFWDCFSLTSVTIPNSVNTIGDNTFNKCSRLTSVNIPNSVTSIGNCTFQDCSRLTSLIISNSVTSIGDKAFQYCSGLTDVYCLADNVPNTSSNAFDNSNIGNATLHVSGGSVDAYKAVEPWKNFKNIVEITGEIINVPTAGTLSAILLENEVDPLEITELALTGELNGDDLRLIREMAGNDYLGQPTDGVLKKLDLSGANIVAGGEKYLDTDRITSSTSTYTQNNGENSFHYETENNVLGKSLFAGCDKLEEVILPNSLTAIGEYQFWYCLNLKSVSIGKNVSSIGRQLVYGPNKLTNISVDEGNTTFSSPANTNLLMQGTKVVLGFGNPTFPAGTTVIGSEAFSSCDFLGDITIPEGVTTIEGGAFAWSSLKSISFPSTLTTIENDAFAGCYLTSFTLPKTVTHYGDGLGALKDCGNLTSISVEKDNPVYDSRDNCNAIIETSTNTLISGCKNTVIPTSVTILGYQAFRGVTLPQSDYVIPNWITTIGEMAFWNAKMTSVTIPSSVTYIGGNAFAYPISLTTVTVESATPVTISENTFTDRSTIDLIVPVGSIATYKATDYWKEFKTIKDVNGNTEDDPSTSGIINVATAGTLSQLISDDEKLTITDLTITGQLNGTDFRLLREMAGNNYKGQPTEGKLQKLDLSDATIVDGGDTYLDLDDYYINIGNNKQLFCFDGKQQTTEANTFGKYLFAGCQQLKTVKTPTSLRKICNQVFAESGLTNIELNSGLTTLDRYALWQSKLSSIMIPKTVIHIGDPDWVDNPFAYNNNLTSITLEAGNSRYSMSAGGKLLIDNTNHAVVCALGNETIPDGITAIGSHAFCNRPELVNYIIPEGVTTLTDPSNSNNGDYTFNYCVNLESIVIPEGIKVIPLGAFTECPKLNSVIIPSSVERIEFKAFDNTGLTEITIPANVTDIGGKAFAHNQNLKTVISYITTPFDIDDGVFAISETTYPQILKVPYGTKALYEAKTGWNKFANIVEMEPASTITITAKSYSRAYGEANPTFESDVTGGTVTGTPSITCAATATSGVGTYDIVITAGTITDPNVQYVNGTLTVTKAPLKITAGSYTKKQGEENPTFALTYDGFKNNETAAVFTTQPTITCAATKDSPVGTYDITVSGAAAANYEISYVAGKLTIEAAPAPEPTPMPEPKGTTFDLDTDDSSTTEVKISFVVKESDSAGTPTVAVSDDKDASGSVSIPESVTHNGVEYKVTEISEGAFQNNTSLTEVKIPASITSIGANAFAGCKNLQAITINIIVPINIAVISARALTRTESGDVFEGVNKETCILYVPEGSVDAYKAAPVWKDFKNILVIGSATGIKGIEMTEGETFDVFNLYGLKVKSQATSLDGLPRGIYVVKGKKVMK